MKTKKGLPRPRSKTSDVETQASLDGLLGMVDLAGSVGTRKSVSFTRGKAKAGLHLPSPVVVLVVGVNALGQPQIGISSRGKSKPLTARSTLPVTVADIGRQALVFFEQGDAAKPIIIGLLESNGRASENEEPMPKKHTLQTEQELVLKCGSASITLTKDGRIVIRGSDVLTRSSGSNRIKGGSVHIN